MTTEHVYEGAFATGDRCALTLVNVRGRVSIIGWDRPEVKVVAVKRLGNYMGAQQAYDDSYVAMDHDGPSVRLRTRTTKGFNPFAWMGLGTTQPEVEYAVQVPRQGEFAVRCVGGPVEIRDVSGSVYARAVSGDIFLEGIGGSSIVRGVNGRVSAQDLSGKLAARTVDGSIAIRQSRLTALTARTVSGDVTLESPLAEGSTYSVETVSGDLRLYQAAGARATLHLDSTSGMVRSDLPAITDEQRLGHQKVTLCGGGPLVEMRSVSGGILVGLATAEGPSQEASPTPAAESPASAAAMAPPKPEKGDSPELDVLRAVERGELSVDEALKRLEDLMGQ